MNVDTKGFLLITFSCQEGVLSPVQDGDNKPQIDSNKANNYNIVKEVNSMLSYFQVMLGILFCVSNRRVCLIFRSYFGSVSCVIPVRRVVCSSRGCLRTWGPTLWCWTCCRSPMRRWVVAKTADVYNSVLTFSLTIFQFICVILPRHRVMRR